MSIQINSFSPLLSSILSAATSTKSSKSNSIFSPQNTLSSNTAENTANIELKLELADVRTKKERSSKDFPELAKQYMQKEAELVEALSYREHLEKFDGKRAAATKVSSIDSKLVKFNYSLQRYEQENKTLNYQAQVAKDVPEIKAQFEQKIKQGTKEIEAYKNKIKKLETEKNKIVKDNIPAETPPSELNNIELKTKLAQIKLQKTQVTSNYPEVEAQLTQQEAEVVKELSYKEHLEKFAGKESAAKKVSDIEAELVEKEFALKQVTEKQNRLKYQSLIAQDYPEASKQYQLLSKEIEEEKDNLNTEITNLKNKKSSITKESTPEKEPASGGNNIMKMIMILLLQKFLGKK